MRKSGLAPAILLAVFPTVALASDNDNPGSKPAAPSAASKGDPSEPSEQPSFAMPKRITMFNGTCRFQLVKGFAECEPQVLYAELPNGRAFLTFTAGANSFTVSGNGDRQPNLENFYQSIDTFRISEGAKIIAEDNNMEGECHFSLNKDASRFFFVKCDVYDRAKGTLYALYLDNIASFKRKDF